MRPKGKLFALFAVFAAIGLVTASGAFTTVQADRTAEVNVAGDSGALLSIAPANSSTAFDSSNANAYAQNVSGEVEISLNGGFNDENAQGINDDARTQIDNVINLTNRGSQTVYVEIDRSGTNAGAVGFYEGASYGSSANITETSSESITLTTGETAQVSIQVNTRDGSFDQTLDRDDQILQSVTIEASANDPNSA